MNKKITNQSPTPSGKVGIGLRSPHINQILTEKPKISWLEVHTENYYAAGGPAIKTLQEIRKNYPKRHNRFSKEERI